MEEIKLLRSYVDRRDAQIHAIPFAVNDMAVAVAVNSHGALDTIDMLAVEFEARFILEGETIQ